MRAGQTGRGATGLKLVGWAKRSVPTLLLRLAEIWWARRKRAFAHPTNSLMPQLRLHHGLANLGAAVGAFIGEVDLRHAPMRLDVAHEHRKSDAARTNDEGWLCVIVIMDIGWHVGSPQEKLPRK